MLPGQDLSPAKGLREGGSPAPLAGPPGGGPPVGPAGGFEHRAVKSQPSHSFHTMGENLESPGVRRGAGAAMLVAGTEGWSRTFPPRTQSPCLPPLRLGQCCLNGPHPQACLLPLHPPLPQGSSHTLEDQRVWEPSQPAVGPGSPWERAGPRASAAPGASGGPGPRAGAVTTLAASTPGVLGSVCRSRY